MEETVVIDLVVGARPNFVKAAAIIHAAKKYPDIRINLIHTGQHTGEMSKPFFDELELPYPEPHRILSFSGSKPTVPERLGGMISMLSSTFKIDQPDYAMVVGDTDSTLAGALAAVKMGIRVIHVEAGLRCGDLRMQEEINRILVDSVSDIAYATTEEARTNLIAEGFRGRILAVGNVMVDTLFRFGFEARKKYPRPAYLTEPYAILTLHRAETVDDDKIIFPILDAVREVAETMDIIFPVHPRLRSRLGVWHNNGRLIFGEPLSYLRFISLLSDAKFVMTDSGGLQEEATALGIPCLTLRKSTERPETVHEGTNHVVGIDPGVIKLAAQTLRDRMGPIHYRAPKLWDGHAADRIMEDLLHGGTSFPTLRTPGQE